MKVLALFVLAVLGCSLIEGRLYTKCEVRSQLQQALNSLPPKSLPRGVTVDDLVAKIVCQAEESSGLNTSAVNQQGNMRPPRSPDASNTKPKPSQSTSPHSHTNQAENHEEHSGHNHPPPHGQRAKRHLQSSNSPEATPPPSQTKPSASPRHPRASHVNHAASQSTPPASNSNQAENHEEHSGHNHPHPHGQRAKRHLQSSNSPGGTPPASHPSQQPPQSNTPASNARQPDNHEEHSSHEHPHPHGQRDKRHLQSSHTPEATPPPSQTKPSASPRHPRASHVNHAASQSTPPASNSNQAENHEKHSSHDHPHPHGQRDKRHLESSHTPEATPPPSQPSQRPPQSNTPRVCTLFGIFQLSNHFACTDHVTPSANICGTDCSNFLDDNISEDIDCLVKIILSLRKTSTENNWDNLVEMMQPMFAKKCIIAKASDYFAKC